MRRLLLLVLCAALLAGCGKAAPETQGEQESGWPLAVSDGRAVRAVGDRLVILSGPSTLTLVDGAGRVLESRDLQCALDPADPAFQAGAGELRYYDSLRRETVVLDAGLRELRRIAAPRDMVGSPLLSQDGGTLYYCTQDAVRAWDLTTGIRRDLRADLPAAPVLTGIEGSILSWTCGSRSLLTDTGEGRTLYDGSAPLTLEQAEDRYYAAVELGQQQLLLFGRGEEAPTLLTPAGLERGRFLKNLHKTVTAAGNTLSCYDLATGQRESVLNLDGPPVDVTEAGGRVYVLTGDALCPWDTDSTPSGDGERYTAPYGDGDLNSARQLARDLGERYGIEILIGREAADCQPWDYEFTPETRAWPVYRQLELLGETLSRFPAAVWEQMLAPFDAVRVCLVRKITGTPASGSVATANGLQFFSGDGVTLALSVGPQSGRALYHELYHVMEDRLLSQSDALDSWEELNPPGFAYSRSYTAPRDPETRAYAQGENAAFVDVYSMTYPKEDRARILEYAAEPGNEALFRSPMLQAKLQALCTAIRQAYGQETAPEAFPWEQYLKFHSSQ
ncbi:MAG: hypothetical protein Q4F17_11845 [Eubacteriales bacterium]|nr:hypothetical protein [Eubacteriales bacterium]